RLAALRAGLLAGAASSPARNRFSAPSMANIRSGCLWCWRPCSDRSVCRAAASPTLWARPPIPESRDWRCRSRPCRRAATALPISSRWRACPTCCCNGQRLVYPDIRLVYWAGGNPFHHHQDLNRLRRAFARPDTVVVHEQAWTASARHADVVLPATITLEREDIGAAAGDPLLVAMHRAVAPFGEARDDYEIFGG